VIVNLVLLHLATGWMEVKVGGADGGFCTFSCHTLYKLMDLEDQGMNLVVVLLSSLLSGIAGVGISNWHHKKAEKRMHKLRLLEKLLGNRHDIMGDKFTEALNSVFIVFYDSPPVINALKAFHENTMNPIRGTDLANQKLLDLFRAMCEDLDIQIRPLTDTFFLQPFNIRASDNIAKGR